jgi:hypothetical protein
MVEFELELLGSEKRWMFAKPEVRVGRDPACDLVLPSAEFGMVSRQHVVLRVEGGQLWIEDQNTSNGTFVNGNRVARSRVTSGDLMRLGADGPEFRIAVLGAAAVPSPTDLPETHLAQPPETHRAGSLNAHAGRSAASGKSRGASASAESHTPESAMLEQKMNALRALVIVLLVLVVVLAGVSVALLQQIDKNQKTLQEMRAEARGAVQQFMPELDARLTKFERRLDAVEAEMNSVDAKIQAAEDRFILRMERELPRIMDRIIEQKIQELSRRQPPR